MKKNVSAHKLNKTSNFILPLVGYTFSFFKPFLYNAYIGDTCISKKYPYCVYILLKFSGHRSYNLIEKSLLKDSKCKTSYDIHGGTHVMFVVQVEDRYKSDYSLLISGKYSQVSDDAKEAIVKGRAIIKDKEGKPKPSLIKQILYKDEELKNFWEKRIDGKLHDQEVWSRMEAADEVFSPEIMEGLPRKKKIEYEQGRTSEL
jgi:hypothetical protein